KSPGHDHRASRALRPAVAFLFSPSHPHSFPWHECCIERVEMDASEQRLPLQIVEDVTFQQRMWKVEHVGWCVIAAVVVAALCGAFGGSWLGRTTVSGSDGRLALEYDRLWRVRSPTSLKVDVRSPSGGERARIWIARDYIGSMSITEITPQPVRVEGDAERVVFEFAT